jgi:hypothetical protein
MVITIHGSNTLAFPGENMQHNRHQALVYSKVGFYMFVADFIVVSTVVANFLIFASLPGDVIPIRYFTSLSTTAGWHLMPQDLGMIIFAVSAPLLLSILTYWKIIVPLRKVKTPHRLWSIALSILGYVFGLFVGGVLLSLAYFELHSSEV